MHWSHYYSHFKRLGKGFSLDMTIWRVKVPKISHSFWKHNSLLRYEAAWPLSSNTPFATLLCYLFLMLCFS